MNMNKLALSILVLLLLSVPAMAKSGCEYCSKGYSGKSSYHGGLEDKFFIKAHKMIAYKEELGLSDEQVETIRGLKLSVKKELILKNADAGVLAVDVHAGLREHHIDVEAMNKLIDQKYAVKKAKSQSLVKAYAELKGVLSEEQMDKLKELWKS